MTREREFIVYGLRDFPTCRTMADSEKQAVMHVLIRNLGVARGRLYADKKKQDGSELSDFAVEIPRIVTKSKLAIENGLPLSPRDQELLEPYAVAQQLAAKNGGSPHNYFGEANALLKNSRRAR